jgi:hypothetical protein
VIYQWTAERNKHKVNHTLEMTGSNEYVAKAGASSVSVYITDPCAPSKGVCLWFDVGGGGITNVEKNDGRIEKRFAALVIDVDRVVIRISIIRLAILVIFELSCDSETF